MEKKVTIRTSEPLCTLNYGINHDTMRPNIGVKDDCRRNRELRVSLQVVAEIVEPVYEIGDEIPTVVGDIPFTQDAVEFLADELKQATKKADENAALVYALINKYVMPEINQLCGTRFAEPLPGTISMFRGFPIHVFDDAWIRRHTPEL